ncbi:MAG: hypothetical protein VX265_05130 [Myxococcota bacterium]|nr:hypothetical protein [Myxococcota bacterium]MEC8422772.1 hypothetical protein [Myxococcota bacterium]
MPRLLPVLFASGLAACGAASPDTGRSDTAGTRNGRSGAGPWVHVENLEWRRQGPNVAVRFRTDVAVRTRVCDAASRCVPAGEGHDHGVILATGASTLQIQAEADDGALAVFGPFAVSDD